MRLLLALLALAAVPRLAGAQSQESQPPPKPGAFVSEPAPPPKSPFMFPDLPHRFQNLLRFDSRWFALKTGIVVLIDYNAFRQDATNVSQVGAQGNGWDARAMRLIFSGTFGDHYKVGN